MTTLEPEDTTGSLYSFCVLILLRRATGGRDLVRSHPPTANRKPQTAACRTARARSRHAARWTPSRRRTRVCWSWGAPRFRSRSWRMLRSSRRRTRRLRGSCWTCQVCQRSFEAGHAVFGCGRCFVSDHLCGFPGRSRGSAFESQRRLWTPSGLSVSRERVNEHVPNSWAGVWAESLTHGASSCLQTPLSLSQLGNACAPAGVKANIFTHSFLGLGMDSALLKGVGLQQQAQQQREQRAKVALEDPCLPIG